MTKTQFSPEILAQFHDWMELAKSKEINDPNAMNIATLHASGRLSSRMVLCKSYSLDGLVFYTNLESDKGQALAQHQQIAALFHWKSLQRQIRVEGIVSQVANQEADDYFASRPRDSQIGAWASMQSRPMKNRAEFMARIAEFTAKFGLGKVPRPPHWHGFLIQPNHIEFWQDKPFRLHDRQIYDYINSTWQHQIYYP